MKRLLSVTVFSGLLTLFRMGAGFFVAKMIAVYTGPSGLAMLGQLQSIASSLSGIVNAPVSSGIVRYTAEHADSGEETCANWWRAGVRWVVIILSVLIPLVCLFSIPLSLFLLGNSSYYYLLVTMVLFLPFTAIGTLLNSIVNGQKRFKKYIIIGMISVCISTMLMFVCIVKGHLNGALLAVSIQNGLIGIVTFLCCSKEGWLKGKNLFGSVERVHMRCISNYMLMALATALTLPIALILIRNILIHYEGWDAAGEWQAVWKISETYLAVITIALGTYYLPKLASLKSSNALKSEVFITLKIILPIAIIMAIMVFILRDFIIFTLFTEKFYNARELFSIQLCGDIIKVASWLMSYPMLARGDIRWYISSEFLFAILFVSSAFFLVRIFGVDGANYAYLVSYCVYFIFICLYLFMITKENNTA
jgi:PST family polysaccharide transporter